MGQSKTAKRAASLRKAVSEQGRSTAWLAREMGFSRGYVSNVLHGRVAWTDEFQRRALTALNTGATVPVVYRGRTIVVPKNVYDQAATLPEVIIETVYEDAWKAAWIQENGGSALAVAAERAWQVAQAAMDIA